jgi:hypothetical protein
MRRAWLGAAVAGMAAALLLVSCDAGGEPPAPPPSASPAGPSAAAPPGCPVPPAGTAAAGAALRPAPGNGLPPTTARGEPLVLEAVVLDAACRPAAGAAVNVWHTDARGLYRPPDAASDRCCYYQGTVTADAAGRFRLETIRPAQYPVPNAPPAHIHLEVAHGGTTLGTEIVFDGPSSAATAPPTGHTLPIALTRSADGWRGTAVFVLAP